MEKKQTIRRILSFILSLTLVMGDIPVLPTVITANAGSEEEAVISEDAVSEDAVSDDTANPEDETVSDNEAVTDDTIEPEDDIKENYTEDTNDSDEISIPSGGIITMPWDIDVPAADDSLTIADIDEMVEGEAVPVEEIRADNSDRSSEPGDDHDYDGSAIRIVSLDSEIVGSVAPALNENAGSAYPAAYTDTTTINGHLAKISPTRNQNPFGTCWAHASIALAELYSIVNQGKNASDVNYSERHLAYYTYAQGTPLTNSNGEILINNPGDSITGNVPEWYILDKGGNVGDAAQNLMRWRGVVAENTVPYPSSDQISGNKHNMLDYSYTATIEYADVVRLENCYVINIKSNPEIVKRYIKAYGGAAISYYHPGDAIQGTTNANYQQYVNPETSAFYYDGNITTTNHAVTIVGWDDNYPAANFNSGHRPEHNGAWLVRNSWISEYSSLNSVDNYNGYFTYFWMSYDNKSMSDSAYVYKLQDDDKWLDNNYTYNSQYSNIGSFENPAAKTANVFIANGATEYELLEAVTIQNMASKVGDSNYRIEIYTDLIDDKDPASGTLVSAEEGSLPFRGIYTIRLDDPVKLKHGENFSVVVALDNSMVDIESGTSYGVNVGDDQTYSNIVTAECGEAGQSFYYLNGNASWNDFYDQGDGNCCISAQTNDIIQDSMVTDLTGNYTAGTGVVLNWHEASGAQGYRVYRCDTPDGNYVVVPGGENVSSTSFTDNTEKTGTVYFYRVLRLENNSAGYSQPDLSSASDIVAVSLGDVVQNKDLNIGSFNLTTAQVDYDGKKHAAVFTKPDDYNGSITYYYASVLEDSNEISGSWLQSVPYMPGMYQVKIKASNYGQYNAAELTDTSWRFTIATNDLQYAKVTLDYSKVEYDNKSHYAEPISVILCGKKLSSNDYSLTYIRYSGTGADANFVSPGQYSVKITPKTSAYTGSTTKVYYIIPRTLTVTADAKTMTVNGQLPELTYTVSDEEKVSGEEPAFDGALSVATDGKTIGTYDITQGTLALKDNGSFKESNYRINFVKAMLTVEAAVKYDVHFVADETTVSEQQVSEGGKPVKPADPVKDHYEFAGWYKEESCTTPWNFDSDTIASETTIYGHWLPIMYNISYDYNSEDNAQVVNPPTYTIESEITLLTPSRSGYIFDGWTGTGLTEKAKTVTIPQGSYGNRSYTAHWVPGTALNVSDITYNAPEFEYNRRSHSVSGCYGLPTDYEGSLSYAYAPVTEGIIGDFNGNEPVNAGIYQVQVTAEENGKYKETVLTDVSWRFTIRPYSLENDGVSLVIDPAGSSFTYNGNAQKPADNYISIHALNGILNPDDYELSFPEDIINAGEKTITATGKGNYTGTVSGSYTIEKATLTITAKPNTISYGNAPANDGVEYSGFISGDNENVVSGTLSYAYSYEQYGDVGSSYTITPSGLSADNYDITFIPGTLIVEPKEVGLTWGSTSLTFNGSAQAPTASVTGTVNNDMVSVTVTGAQTNAGDAYTATASALTGTKTGNYKLPESKTTSFSIAKAGAQTITDITLNKSYSATSATASLSGKMPANAGNLTYRAGSASVSKANGSSVELSDFTVNENGIASVTISNGTAGDVITLPVTITSQNYEDSSVNVIITLQEKESVTVSFQESTPLTKTYGDASFSLHASVTVNGGTWTWISSNTDVATVTDGTVKILKAGETDITATYESDTHLGSATITLKVEQKPVSITGLSVSDKEYDGNTTATVKSNGSLSGVAAGDIVSINAGTSSFSDKNAGNNKTVSFNGFSLSGKDKDNYILSAQPSSVKAAITAKEAVLNWTDTEFTYDGESHCPKATVTNLISGDSCSVNVSGAKTNANPEGSPYTATATGLTNSNYKLPADKNTSFTISKAAIVLTAPEARTGLIYNGADQELISGGSVNIDTVDILYAVTNTSTAPAAGNYSTDIPVGKNAGDHYVWYKVPGTANYSEISADSIKVTIDRRVVSVNEIKAKDKTYDATTSAEIDDSSIVIEGKADQYLSITADLKFIDADAGKNKTVNISNIRLTGSTSANYILSGSGIPTTASADINKRKVTVTPLEQTVIVYGDINGSVSMASLSGAVEGHALYSVSLNAGDTSHKTSNGTITASDATISSNSVDVTANYEIEYKDGKLIVLLGEAAAVTTVPQENTGLIYDGTPLDLVSAGDATDGTLMYALGEDNETEPSSDWTETVPTGVDADTYYVWYKVFGNESHDDSVPVCIEVTIEQRAVIVKALDQSVSINSAINGSVSMAQLSGQVSGHTLYSVTLTSDSTAKVTAAGEISASAAVIRNGNTNVTSNYKITYVKGVLTVTAVEAVVITPPTARQLKYNAEAQKLVSKNGVAEGGELTYALSTNGETAPADGFDPAIPAATDAGTYHVWYMVKADKDHENSTPVCLDVTIVPARYSIIYSKNDGSGAVVSQNKTIGKAGDKATISINGISRKGYVLAGWNDKADGSGKPYKNGDEYTPVRKEDKSFTDLTIYAQWEAAVSLNSISINKAPDKTEYLEGENFDPKGMVVVAYYTDNSSKEVSGYTYTPSTNLALTDKKVTVSYTEGDITCTAEQAISVSANGPEETVSLNSISINKAPDKTEYLEGESFDPAGMVVVANYTDNTSKEVTGYTYTPSSNLALTDDKVTVSYTEEGITCTAVQKISVSANEAEVTVSLNSISITKAPVKTAYKEGEKFDKTGMVVTATYTDESTREVTAYTYTPAGELTTDDKMIIVSYTEVDITCTAELKISVSHVKTEAEEGIIEDEDYFIWNLYEDSSAKTLKIKGVSVNEAVSNTNFKSAAYYKATLSGNTISVSLTGNNLANAAKAENTLLEFKTADGGIIEYTLPVEYKKPELKLSTTSATIKKGTASKVQTTVLYKTAGGNYEPLDLTGGEVKYEGKAAEIMEYGVISFTATDSGKGKISISGEGWNANDPIELTFTVKASKKDVLSVDLGGAKYVVINQNVKGQSFDLPVYLNGEKAGALDIEDKAKTGLARYADGILTVSNPTGWNLKPKTYTITLSNGDVKANVKIRVTNKELAKSISLKVQSKYDVVTGQKMVIVPTLKDIDGEITGVSVTDKNYSAVVNEAGNIVVDYSGDALDAKHLKIGNLTFKLKISDVEEEVSVTIKNVKAKKSSVSVKAAKVKMNTEKAGVANLVCSYKDSAGNLHLIAPIDTSIVKPKNVKAVVGDDPTVINISELSKKSGSVKLKLTFAGNVTKTVTVKVSK